MLALVAQLGPVHPITVGQRYRLVDRLAAAGETEVAIDRLRRLVDDMHRWLGPSDPATVAAHAALVELLSAAGKTATAARERLLVAAAIHIRAARHRYGDGLVDEALGLLQHVDEMLDGSDDRGLGHARLRALRLRFEWLLDAGRTGEAESVSAAMAELMARLQAPAGAPAEER